MRMTATPRTEAALIATLDAGFDLGPEHRILTELCRAMERELAADRDREGDTDEALRLIDEALGEA